MILYLDDWRTPPKIENLKSATSFEDFVFLLDTYSSCIDQIDIHSCPCGISFTARNRLKNSGISAVFP